MSKPSKQQKLNAPQDVDTEAGRFTSALSQVLSASPSVVRAAVAASKSTKPSLHTRFVYDPAKGHA
jgi:hypothetical protein